MFLISQVKLYHWTTRNYAIHKALDELYNKLNDKVDHLIETYIGFYNSNKKQRSVKIISTNFTDNGKHGNITKFLSKQREIVNSYLKEFEKVSEIKNILEDIMGDIDNTIYLCNLDK